MIRERAELQISSYLKKVSLRQMERRGLERLNTENSSTLVGVKVEDAKPRRGGGAAGPYSALASGKSTGT